MAHIISLRQLRSRLNYDTMNNSLRSQEHGAYRLLLVSRPQIVISFNQEYSIFGTFRRLTQLDYNWSRSGI